MTVANPLVPLESLSFRDLIARAGVVAVSAPPAQIQPHLISLLLTLIRQGERVAIIVANNQFDVYAIARTARRQGLAPEAVLERIQVARAETVYQVRRCARRVPTGAQGTSVLVVFGLLDAFLDEAIRRQDAQKILDDTLTALRRLSEQDVRVLVTVTPAEGRARAFLRGQLVQSIDAYVQIAPPALEQPRQQRLF